MIVIENRDVPGIVGAVGTLLGKHQINIAHMSWGRMGRGQDAITVLDVDDEVTPEVIAALRALPNIVSVKHVVV
jgi:D-3-phosphoglycerate dehydrogenase / 2-oxoglutarate reductase